MLRKIGLTLLCAASVFTAPGYSSTPQLLQKGLVMEYDLQPNEPQLFINYTFWTVEANCKVVSEDDSMDLFAVALAKAGAINDQPLSSGQSVQLTVHAGDVIKLRANSGAKVQITNLSEHSIHAVCIS